MSTATVADWNQLAICLGKAGYPGERGLPIVLRRYFKEPYSNYVRKSSLELIPLDEGFFSDAGLDQPSGPQNPDSVSTPSQKAALMTKPIAGYHMITPDDLHWRPSNLMQIPNADFLERTGSGNLGARLWRLPPKSANTRHKHIRQEEFYFVLEGTGRIRIGEQTLTVPRYGGVWVGPEQLRQVFNDTDSDALWLIVGGPEEQEFLKGSQSEVDLSPFYPVDPTELPKELDGVQWPPTNTLRKTAGLPVVTQSHSRF